MYQPTHNIDTDKNNGSLTLEGTDELELTRILKSESKNLVVLKKVGINHSNWYQKVCLTKWFYCAGNIGAKQQASYLRLRTGIHTDQMR